MTPNVVNLKDKPQKDQDAEPDAASVNGDLRRRIVARMNASDAVATKVAA